MSASTQGHAELAVRVAARSRHADAGVVTEMARSLRREARRARESRRSRGLQAGRAIEAARLCRSAVAPAAAQARLARRRTASALTTSAARLA